MSASTSANNEHIANDVKQMWSSTKLVKPTASGTGTAPQAGGGLSALRKLSTDEQNALMGVVRKYWPINVQKHILQSGCVSTACLGAATGYNVGRSIRDVFSHPMRSSSSKNTAPVFSGVGGTAGCMLAVQIVVNRYDPLMNKETAPNTNMNWWAPGPWQMYMYASMASVIGGILFPMAIAPMVCAQFSGHPIKNLKTVRTFVPAAGNLTYNYMSQFARTPLFRYAILTHCVFASVYAQVCRVNLQRIAFVLDNDPDIMVELNKLRRADEERASIDKNVW